MIARSLQLQETFPDYLCVQETKDYNMKYQIKHVGCNYHPNSLQEDKVYTRGYLYS